MVSLVRIQGDRSADTIERDSISPSCVHCLDDPPARPRGGVVSCLIRRPAWISHALIMVLQSYHYWEVAGHLRLRACDKRPLISPKGLNDWAAILHNRLYHWAVFSTFLWYSNAGLSLTCTIKLLVALWCVNTHTQTSVRAVCPNQVGEPCDPELAPVRFGPGGGLARRLC